MSTYIRRNSTRREIGKVNPKFPLGWMTGIIEAENVDGVLLLVETDVVVIGSRLDVTVDSRSSLQIMRGLIQGMKLNTTGIMEIYSAMVPLALASVRVLNKIVTGIDLALIIGVADGECFLDGHILDIQETIQSVSLKVIKALI
ncbi:hypothetical protein D8B26_001045 [Coccidioides posadasii str. Silveira]|uniref:uncharacterized protein n=1 Tax=Coccidioides posadasii (strain RMSCC 757 / Silveira) TaxID=443226 RepID=UPI001BEEA40B|nr:hypothetical protein D8B26_001045 [Coccidioides posadasii str. Silveira]